MMMKKYTQLLIVLLLVLAVIGVATNNSAWAGAVPRSQNAVVDAQSGIANLLQSGPITVTATGSYNVEGVCSFDMEVKGTGVEVKGDARIPLKESEKIPFNGQEDEKLAFPGCHFVHSKDGKVVKELDSKDGNGKVCFGTNLTLKTQIYFYYDKEFGDSVWAPLPTSINANGVACASAPYSGVYMPATRPYLPEEPGYGQYSLVNPGPNPGGSVVPPPSELTITKSGTYAIGGICAFIIEYKVEKLSDEVHVHHPTEGNDVIEFPFDGGQLDLPGCHIIHYEDSLLVDQMTPVKGNWGICFAARPNKDMTIYFYRDLQDDSDVPPIGPWVPLESTTENGLVCAPVTEYSGVYAPVEK